MSNFKISFSNPWFLFLLIPAAILTLVPYFRMNKRYRKSRNKIVPIVLHLIVMVLTVAVISGMTFEYDVSNKENEVILLVDTSDSADPDVIQKREDFVQSVISYCDSKFKLGVVTFGFDQVYAAELTYKTEDVLSQYLQSPSPDNSATNISAALTYAASLFKSPKSARIVLISDGIETDGDASSVIKSIAAQGIKVDSVQFINTKSSDEVRLVDIKKPDEKIKVGDKFSVEITLQSSYTGKAKLTSYDNGVVGAEIDIELIEGLQTVNVPYVFMLPGMHKMSFELVSNNDTNLNNNEINSYIYLETFDKLLVIENIEDESKSFCEMLRQELNVDVKNIYNNEALPKTVDELRAYDEIVLCNIANADLPEGFDQLLYSYVYEYGGGLFTICGNKEDSNPNDELFTPNAYTEDDMYGTLYQEMLPVEIIEYTPPTAVMIIIDRSGSMGSANSNVKEEESKLGYAKLGAEACLDALTERDYVGIMTFSETATLELELTPRPQKDKILNAIAKVKRGGSGTIFSVALERAGKELAAMSGVDRKHIILVTDGEPSTDDTERYSSWLEENAKLGITMSIVGIQCSNDAVSKMKSMLVECAQMQEKNFHNVEDVKKVPQAMREDLIAPEIKSVNYETFHPTLRGNNSLATGMLDNEIPTLDGFYGVKAKKGAEILLMGTYTPIYTQWIFGKGRVGTFACDLNGTWSSDFIASPNGSVIVNNIVQALFPTEKIQPVDMELEYRGDNYLTDLSIFTQLSEGEFIEITVTSPSRDGAEQTRIQNFKLSYGEVYSKLSFAVTTPGIHEIRAAKKSADGTVLAEYVTYKPLSYSKEYTVFNDKEAAEKLCEKLAASGNGNVLDDPFQVFENAVEFIHCIIDPKNVFMIAAVSLFLLGIAARKFKWKWPGEIIRERKAKKAMSKSN